MKPNLLNALNDKTFSEEQLDQLASQFDFNIEGHLYDEIRQGLIDELGETQTYTLQSLSNDKLFKAMAKVIDNLKHNPNHYSKPTADTFAHVLTGKQQLPAGVTRSFESKLNKMIEDELMKEGFSDFLKKVKPTGQEAWNQIVGMFSKAVNSMKGAISKKVAQINGAKAYLEKWKNAVEQAEQETGEKFPVDNTMKIAMSLEAKAKEANQEIAADKAQISKQPSQTQTTEAFIRSNTKTIIESINESKKHKVVLNESITATTVIGFALALLGGIPMLLKGLYVLAKKYNFVKTAEALHHAYHIAHQIEKKTVDIVIPDKLSYAVYKKIWKMGFRPKETAGSTELLSYEDFTADAHGVRHHVEETVYRLMLTYFFIAGASAVLSAGISMLTAAEAGATTIKAVEIARAVTTAVETVAPGAITAARGVLSKGKVV